MTGFLDLPGEVRDMIYKHLLVFEEPIDPIHRSQKSLTIRVNILRTNKTVHSEASSLLYGQNCFDVSRYRFKSEKVVNFLNQIHRNNAGNIRSIRIAYPRIDENAACFRTILESESCRTVAKIKSDCPNLMEVILAAHPNSMIGFFTYFHFEILKAGFSLAKDLLGGFSSHPDITVEVHDDIEVYEDDERHENDVNALQDEQYGRRYMRREMKNLGWKIKKVDQVKEGPDDDYIDHVLNGLNDLGLGGYMAEQLVRNFMRNVMSR